MSSKRQTPEQAAPEPAPEQAAPEQAAPEPAVPAPAAPLINVLEWAQRRTSVAGVSAVFAFAHTYGSNTGREAELDAAFAAWLSRAV